jgi:transcriptional regulator with XRE-family HTH domain
LISATALATLVAVTSSGVARLDAASLHAALDAQRRARGLTWRQVAAETGVSVATLTGTARGGRLEADGVMCMLRWLGLPAEVFLRGPAGAPPELMDQIAVLFRARSDLSPAAAAEFEAIVRDAYVRLRTTDS